MKRITSLLIVIIGFSISGLAYGQDPTEISEGAKAWAKNCTRCHNARSPLERNDRDWATISAHMRARANLTKTETRMIVAYLQMMNGSESGSKADTSVNSTPKNISTNEGSKKGEKRKNFRMMSISSRHK